MKTIQKTDLGLVSVSVVLSVFELQALATLANSLSINNDILNKKFPVLKGDELKDHLFEVNKMCGFIIKIVQDTPSVQDVEKELFEIKSEPNGIFKLED